MSVQLPHPDSFETNEEPTITNRSTRIEYQFNALVARKGSDFIFLDYLFDNSTDNETLFGAVGTKMRPVHRDEAKRRIAEYKDPETSPLKAQYDNSDTAQSWETWVQSEITANGMEVLFDSTNRHLYENTVREQCEKVEMLDGEDVQRVECVRTGRVFDNEEEYDVVYDEELLRIIEDVQDSGLHGLEL